MENGSKDHVKAGTSCGSHHPNHDMSTFSSSFLYFLFLKICFVTCCINSSTSIRSRSFYETFQLVLYTYMAIHIKFSYH